MMNPITAREDTGRNHVKRLAQRIQEETGMTVSASIAIATRVIATIADEIVDESKKPNPKPVQIYGLGQFVIRRMNKTISSPILTKHVLVNHKVVRFLPGVTLKDRLNTG
jgi:nucleoid DNA-binding protein